MFLGKINRTLLKKSFQWMFLIGFMGFYTPVFSVVGIYDHQSFTSLQGSLKEDDLTILFGEDPMRNANKVQSVKEAFTFFLFPAVRTYVRKQRII